MLKTVEAKIHTIPANHVVVGATKPRARKHFNPEALALLTENIRIFGQKIPGLCFRNINEDIELIAGERRLRACMALQTEFRYILEEDMTDELLYELEIMENLQREGLTWQEEVIQFLEYHRFLEDKHGKARPGTYGGHTMEKTALRLGISKGRLSEDLELAEWASEIPEVASASSKTDAKKVVKKLKDMAERGKLLAEAKIRMEAVEAASGVPTPKVDASAIAAFKEAYAEKFGEEALQSMQVEAEKKKKEMEERKQKALSKIVERGETEDIDPVAKAYAHFETRCFQGDMEHRLLEFPDEHFDIVIFDPPWGVDFDVVRKENPAQKGYADSPLDFADKIEMWIKLLYSKMAKDSHLYLFFGMPNHGLVHMLLQANGFETNGIPILWHKRGAHRTRNPKVWPGRSYEPIAYARKGKKDLVSLGASDIKETAAPTARIKSIHPSAKHPDIMLDLLLRSARPGDKVLDPMAGSGMTGIACEKLKNSHSLDWWLIERDTDYRELTLYNLLQGYDRIVGEQSYNEEAELASEQLRSLLSENGSAEDPAEGSSDEGSAEGYTKLRPGTREWTEYFTAHPTEQEAMLLWRKEKEE
uniref:Putative methyltransferase n=1 Tax=viral metagenome TaxID=1070528 RepID=A0A6H1ZN38_9ZZZZ